MDYSGARKISSAATWEDGPATSNLPRKLRNPASATLAMKFSSTRTFAVLKSLWIKRGLREWRWARPAYLHWAAMELKNQTIRFFNSKKLIQGPQVLWKLLREFCQTRAGHTYYLNKRQNKYQGSQNAHWFCRGSPLAAPRAIESLCLNSSFSCVTWPSPRKKNPRNEKSNRKIYCILQRVRNIC